MLPNFAYVRAAGIQEAVEQLSTKDAVLHAGGTDLLGCLRDHVFAAETLVSISGIQTLKGIRQDQQGGLRIGALTTVAQTAVHPLVRRHYPALAQAASEVASPQLRNQGTMGGNLCQKPRCWYYRGEFDCLRKGGDTCFAVDGENQFHCILGGHDCYIVHPSDTAPALVAFGAEVRITGPGGKTRQIALERFHVRPEDDPTRETILAPNEIVTEIILPAPASGQRSAYRKVRARRSWDFALAGVALALDFDGKKVIAGRVVLSGAAPVPWRAETMEKRIIGSTLEQATIEQAVEAAVQGAEPMSQNAYKVPLFKGVLTEELIKISNR